MMLGGMVDMELIVIGVGLDGARMLEEVVEAVEEERLPPPPPPTASR